MEGPQGQSTDTTTKTTSSTVSVEGTNTTPTHPTGDPSSAPSTPLIPQTPPQNSTSSSDLGATSNNSTPTNNNSSGSSGQIPVAGGGEATPPKKQTTSVKDVGVASERNGRHRRFMEDAHTIEDGICGDPHKGFFGVYDGHGGKTAALYIQAHMHKVFEEEYKALGKSAEEGGPEVIAELLKRVFKKTDSNMKETVPAAGACVVVAFVQKKTDGKRWLYTANAGDSRAILNRDGKALRLTEEHKPNNPQEAERLKKLGAFISDDGITQRVNGMIGISRALGDHMMKELIVNDPYLWASELHENDKFLILACDGVWDVLTDQEAVDLLKDETDPTAMAKKLLTAALKGGSTDNITVVVIIL